MAGASGGQGRRESIRKEAPWTARNVALYVTTPAKVDISASLIGAHRRLQVVLEHAMSLNSLTCLIPKSSLPLPRA